MESLGLTVPTQGQLTADFLDELNEQFESKRSILFNNVRLNDSYPKTLFEAYKIMTELSEPSIPTKPIQPTRRRSQTKPTTKRRNGNLKDTLARSFVTTVEMWDIKPAFAQIRRLQTPPNQAACQLRLQPQLQLKMTGNKTSRVNFTQQKIMEFFGFTTWCMKVDDGRRA